VFSSPLPFFPPSSFRFSFALSSHFCNGLLNKCAEAGVSSRGKTGLLKKNENEEAALVPVNKSPLKCNQSDDRYFSRREIF